MTFIAKVSKPGFNVLTTTNPDNLIFSSDYNTLKYYASGNVVLNWVDNGSSYVFTLAHNLGYIPFFIAFVLEGGSTTFYNIIPRDDSVLAGEDYTNVYADETNLYFLSRVNQGTGNPGSTTFYYKIFKNNLGF